MTVTGENQPKTSNILATSDTITLFVTVVLGDGSAIVRQNSSVDSIPSVLVYSLISEMVWTSREFLGDFLQYGGFAGIPFSE